MVADCIPENSPAIPAQRPFSFELPKYLRMPKLLQDFLASRGLSQLFIVQMRWNLRASLASMRVSSGWLKDPLAALNELVKDESRYINLNGGADLVDYFNMVWILVVEALKNKENKEDVKAILAGKRILHLKTYFATEPYVTEEA
jgi:hypothetical protein